MLIVPHYSVIGGWVTKLFEYLRGSTAALAEETYFSEFIADTSSVLWFLLFSLAVTAQIDRPDGRRHSFIRRRFRAGLRCVGFRHAAWNVDS